MIDFFVRWFKDFSSYHRQKFAIEVAKAKLRQQQAEAKNKELELQLADAKVRLAETEKAIGFKDEAIGQKDGRIQELEKRLHKLEPSDELDFLARNILLTLAHSDHPVTAIWMAPLTKCDPGVAEHRLQKLLKLGFARSDSVGQHGHYYHITFEGRDWLHRHELLQ